LTDVSVIVKAVFSDLVAISALVFGHRLHLATPTSPRMPLVSEEARSLFVKWLHRTVIFGTDIIEVLWTGGGFTAGRDAAIFFVGIGFGWGLEVLFQRLFHDSSPSFA
jgi:hypothetical protein